MRLLEGKKTAEAVKKEVLEKVEFLKSKSIEPKLDVIIIGEDDAAMAYVGMIARSSQKYGVASEVVSLPATITEAELLDKIREINADKAVHGLIVQMPLPKGIDEKRVIETIDPLKDVDGFHPMNVGNLSIGEDGFVPCTPYGIYKMTEIEGLDFTGKNVVVLGRSNIVGKPAAMLMLRKNATVTICHSKTKDLAEVTSKADVLIAAIGKKKFVKANMVGEGAIVIDVGIHSEDGKIVGDVDFEDVKDKVSMITPVPGGVGTTTIAMLMHNAVKAAHKQNGLEF
jgi:methylenetetrahydrofolate dehydrogenase (NADP+)/methenyltetrahydrofolate cyclohydrolase